MKIILCGSSGKCGKEVYKQLLNNNYEIVATVDKDSKPLKYYLQIEKDIDLIIDFTNSQVAYKHLLLAIEEKIPFVCGTTGFNNEEIQNLKKLCLKKQIKGIICPNFAMPINILINNFETLSSDFEEVILEEYHHLSKIDIPSGTAKILKKKNPLLKINSFKYDSYLITYHLTFNSKYAKMEIDYKVESKIVYAKGLLYCLKHPNLFYNLLD